MSDNLENEKMVWIEDGIIMTECVAALGEEKIKEFVSRFSAALEAAKGEGRALVNATSSGGMATTSGRGRKLYAEFGKKAKAKKVAIFGINTIQRVVAAFVMKAISKETGLKEIRFFKTKEEALEWLKEE